MCGRWCLPIFLFRHGSLTLMNRASLIALVRFWSSLPIIVKLLMLTLWPEMLQWSWMGDLFRLRVNWIIGTIAVYTYVQKRNFIMTASRDGGLQNLEVHGMITLRITDETKGRVKVILHQGDMKNVQLQVNIKELWCYWNWKPLFFQEYFKQIRFESWAALSFLAKLNCSKRRYLFII